MEFLEIWGSLAVASMALFYALEARSPLYILLFAVSCLLSSGYALAIGSWPFAVVELFWSGIALRRWIKTSSRGSLDLKRT
jgi:hypothetical protein